MTSDWRNAMPKQYLLNLNKMLHIQLVFITYLCFSRLIGADLKATILSYYIVIERRDVGHESSVGQENLVR